MSPAKIHAALAARRAERWLTWREVAHEMGLSPGSLTGLAKAQRVGFPHVMRIVRRLGRPAGASLALLCREAAAQIASAGAIDPRPNNASGPSSPLVRARRIWLAFAGVDDLRRRWTLDGPLWPQVGRS